MSKLEYLLIAALMSVAILGGLVPLQQRLVVAVDRFAATLQPVVIDSCKSPFCVTPAAGPSLP